MIIGAQKCGTTALAEFLDDHPDIEMSNPKEVHLFDSPELDPQQIDERYASAFSDESCELRGEATPIYLYLPGIPEKLHQYNAKLKFIVMLRDPVERAYSHYAMERERGNETLPFWKALLREKVRLANDTDELQPTSARRIHSYRDRGRYSGQLRRLYRWFSPDQVLVLRSDRLRGDHDKTMARIFRFLQVQPADIPGREVFAQGSEIGSVPFSSSMLRWSYRKELRALQATVDFAVDDWY
jgi:hypothetical protein